MYNESTTGADASVKVQDMKLLADLASLANCVANIRTIEVQ